MGLAHLKKTICSVLLSICMVSLAGAQNLQILQTVPEANAPFFDVNGTMSVHFNQALLPATVTDASFLVFGAKKGKIAGQLGLSADSMTVTFQPNVSLLAGDRITVIVTTAVKSVHDLPLDHGHVWEFDTKAEFGLSDYTKISFNIDGLPYSICSADFNGDDQTDWAVVYENDKRYFLQLYFYNNGIAQAGAGIQIPSPVKPLYTGDFDNDGTPDLLLLDRSKVINEIPARFRICFVKPGEQLVLGETYDVGNPVTDAGDSRGAAVSDYNADGFLDIVVVKRSQLGQTAFLYYNNGDGTFTVAEDFSDYLHPEYGFSGDFNNDFRMDCGISFSKAGSGLSLYLNQDSTFSDKQPDVSLKEPLVDLEHLIHADVSGDNRTDLLASDRTSSKIFVYTFSDLKDDKPEYNSSSFLSNTSPIWMQYGDFDADNDLDVAALGFRQGILLLHKNNGAGTFADTLHLNIPDHPVAFTSADLNNDQALDFCIVDSSGQATLFLNQVNQNAAPAQPVAVSPADNSFLNTTEPVLQWTEQTNVSLDYQVQLTNIADPTQPDLVYDTRLQPELFTITPALGSETVTLDVPSLEEGKYTWQVRAWDGYRFSPLSVSQIFTIDVSAPEILSLQLPGGLYDNFWSSQIQAATFSLLVQYTELYAKQAELDLVNMGLTPIVDTNIESGFNQSTNFSSDLSSVSDGEYWLKTVVTDSAQNQSRDSVRIGLDFTPPTGATVTIDNDVINTRSIPLRVSGGTDGAGSGVSGNYNVWVRVDDGAWNLWLVRQAVSDTVYDVSENHKYSFAAAAWDNVGLLQDFNGKAQDSVNVVLDPYEFTAPPAPKNLTANGSNPSPWSNDGQFLIEWDLPQHGNTITKYFWKAGDAPTSNYDTTGIGSSGAAAGPLSTTISQDGLTWLYVWLKDDKENIDFNKRASVLLRNDFTAPQITGYYITPQSPYIVDDGLRQIWFSPLDGCLLNTYVQYSDVNAQYATFVSENLGVNLQNNIAAGNDKETIFNLDACSDGDTYEKRVNCGGSAFTDVWHRFWNADQVYHTDGWGYINGRTSGTHDPIADAFDQTPYKTERYSMGGYKFTVEENGRYQVILHFAETYLENPNARVFNVSIEGQTVLQNFDIYSLVGHDTALTDTFYVSVTDKILDIGFEPVTENPKICGIEVYKTSTFKYADGVYDVNIAVYDSAQNKSQNDFQLGLDSKAPTGCTASTKDTSETTLVPVQWSAGDDASGSGVNNYDVYVRQDAGNWQPWLTETAALQADFQGEQRHLYEFAAIARDRVGNEEVFDLVPETSVWVDTTADDVTPPTGPQSLTANGSSPSPWNSAQTFQIQWQNPVDESGINKSLWKLGSRPAANYDTTGTGPAVGPFPVQAANEGQFWLFLWLVDNNGNVDFQTADSVLLRRDNVPPVIASLAFVNPTPFFTDSTGRAWANQDLLTEWSVDVKYTETQPESLYAVYNNADMLFVDASPTPGTDVQKQYVFALDDKPDGLYNVAVSLKDVASQKTTSNITFGLDHTPPSGIVASGPAISANTNFTVSWSAGTDAGSGMSGKYRVYVQDNGAAWQVWLDNVTARSSVYAGQDGHTYAFEAISWDNLDNQEVRNNAAETTVSVDISAGDVDAPAAPVNLAADGSSPSVWKKTNTFHLTWNEPVDVSGVAKALYKIGSAPASNFDTTATAPANGPVDVSATQQGGQYVYVWFIDAKGNVDYQKNSKVLLKVDSTLPDFLAAQFTNPHYAADWFSTSRDTSAEYQLQYSEAFADSLILNWNGKTSVYTGPDLPVGLEQQKSVQLGFKDKPDGSYPFYITLTDSAGNRNETIDTLKIDQTPPFGTTARSQDSSATTTFQVSWSGSQDNGVGLSGRFSVYVNIDHAGWQVWQDSTTENFAAYNGEHGKTYAFEAVAFDFLGNAEALTGTAETTTVVDTLMGDDLTPPDAPFNITTNGGSQNAWFNSPLVVLNWENPDDPSGILKSWYKLDEAPQSAQDTTGSLAPVPPATLQVNKENGQSVYFWLEDGNQNSGFANNARIYVKWDSTSPKIDSLRLTDTDYNGMWFNSNPSVPKTPGLDVYFDETNTVSIELSPASLLAVKEQPVNKTEASEKRSFALNLPANADSIMTLYITVTDSALNTTTDSTIVALDATPPVGTLALSPDTSGTTTFTVSWAGSGDDGDGSGLSGVYDVKVKIDDGTWEFWQTRFRGTQAQYEGEFNHRYAFQAAAYDNVGHVEAFTGTAETETFVDPDFYDTTAPDSPEEIFAALPANRLWSASANVEINWTNPSDPSGIDRCFYKIGSAPVNAFDTTATAPATPPATVKLQTEGYNDVYFWLKDGNGNVDHETAVKLTLRYDAVDPVVSQAFINNAQFDHKWIHPDSVAQAVLLLQYSEAFPDTLTIRSEILDDKITITDFSSGSPVSVNLPITGLADACYPVNITLTDSAGRSAVKPAQLCIDSQPPDSTFASSPEKSLTEEFAISWGGQSTDGNGSGLSGKFDVRIKIDDGPWYLLVGPREARTSINYVGAHGHSYYFEAVAWDNVGNREAFTGIAESTTRVDTLFVDDSAPGSPENIQVDGENPTLWQTHNQFVVEWQSPADPSGIKRAFYKYDTPPESNIDTTGSVLFTEETGYNTMTLAADKENGQPVYIWLQDGRGNLDYRNYSSILLRYDATQPVISEIRPVDPGYLTDWYNQSNMEQVYLRIFYHDKHPADILVESASLPEIHKEPVLTDSDMDSVDVRIPVASLSDGVYKFFITISDSAGNNSLQDSVTIHLDATAPQVSHTAFTAAVAEDADLNVQIQVQEQNRVVSSKVYFKKGGAAAFTSAVMDSIAPAVFSAFIPADSLTSRGIEYYFVCSDGLNNSRKPVNPDNYSATVKIDGTNSEGLKRTEGLVYGKAENAFRMISFPIEIINNSVENILEDDMGAYDPLKWRFFQWNTKDAVYNEYPDIDPVTPGQAYWFITSLENRFLDTGPGISMDPAEPFVILLKKGWNDIANPFNFDVSWKDIFKASSADTQKISGPYTYEGRWLIPVEVDLMQPWNGYSFYTEEEDISLVIPPVEANQSLMKKSPDYWPLADWYCNLELKIGDADDPSNYFGCAETATKDFDAPYDFIEPPVIGDYASLYFPHSDWQTDAQNYTTDFRPVQDGYVWDVEVISNITNKKAHLYSNFLKTLPPSFDVRLYDLAANLTVNLKQDSVYSFNLFDNDKPRRFKIYAGTEQFFQEQQDDLPQTVDEFELVQNYPNPFNGSTIISYRLKENTDVKVAVYNLLAQQVRLLVSGFQDRGFYQYTWDAKDDYGVQMGTGIYILRLETPQFTCTRKMVYMR